jgi:hypothetical protein
MVAAIVAAVVASLLYSTNRMSRSRAMHLSREHCAHVIFGKRLLDEQPLPGVAS